MPAGRDVLVKIEAIAVNPVDTKVCPKSGDAEKILGFDAAGTVAAIGPDVTLVKPGDKVWHAGDVTRPGTNAEYQLVDERILGERPVSLTAAEAAALPLTALTAWESLFERLGIDPGGKHAGRSLLIIGGAGGVGSIAIQLAKRAGLRVIATASRPESAHWCREQGADEVADHSQALRPQLEALDLKQVDFIANFHNSADYWETMGDLIAPQGRIVLIVETPGDLAFGGAYKSKSVTVSWEFMFTRTLFQTEDMIRQRWILNEVAALIDSGALRSTAMGNVNPITVENLLAAHHAIRSQRTIGKIVLAGWHQ